MEALISIRKILKNIFIKILRITGRDLDYFYNDDFATTGYRNKAWGGEFCNIIMKLFNPRSVIDFGCGSGDLLAAFEKRGIEILGIDGSKANFRHRKINRNNFLLFDIRKAYKSKKKYDLCFCLEVAEHIEEEYSDVLIKSLASSSPLIVFTAEPAAATGVRHINLKPYQWWISKFERESFVFDRALTERLRQEMLKVEGIQDWYVRNLLVFKAAV
ncbi:MAG: methyltransferase domain-containing protein [Candidatus Omnitrophica bacterium]|nr:methyltransferase domain-containing protein [Candidatus Omnitrophota bacterium]MDD4981887.1 methyltransferase domain-containing protein [Candidatus Omnitrophota bacterium]MDD5665108.1 methyltransferase domain-containing protein [Candidatus Omnitrophota bacterium]